MGAGPWTAKDRAEIEAALDDMRTSGVLGRNSRLGPLLDYLVGEELAGRGERIKGYTIGTDVFGRPADFDPNSDSIVRVEVGRLRQALEHYYASAGRDAAVRIRIPKGGYRPRIARAGRRPGSRRLLWPIAAAALGCAALAGLAVLPAMREPERRTAAVPALPTVLVQPFTTGEDDPRARALAVGVTAELVAALTQYPFLAVSAMPRATGDRPAYDPASIGGASAYLLSGELATHDGRVLAAASLVRLPDLSVAWSGRIDRPLVPEEFDDGLRRVAGRVAETIGSARGIVASIEGSTGSNLDGVSLEAYTCLTGLYAYWDAPSDEAHEALRTCLEDATARFPGYGDAWAALTFVYMDEARQGRNPRDGADPWADAEAAVDKALAAAPLRSLVLNAAMSFEADRPDPDFDAFARYGRRELRLRPNNAFTLANFGAKLGVSAGRWKEGMELHEKAMALALDPPAWFHFAPAYHAALSGEDEALYRASRRLRTPGSKSGLLLALIGEARTGRLEAARRTAALLADLGIVTSGDVADYAASRRYEPRLREALERGAAEALSATQAAQGQGDR